jgi:ribosome maturation factor RimP
VGEKPTFLFHRRFSCAMPPLENEELLKSVASLSEQAAAETGIEIADVEVRGAGKSRLLRIYIDRPGGVSHGDCQLISERLGALLDEHDTLVEDSYTLEVSSPGVDRALKKPRDFERSMGQKIKVALREPVNGQRRVEGTVAAVAESAIEIETAPGERMTIPLAQIQKANLKFEW